MDEKIKVKIYSTPDCPYCNMAKAYFSEKGVEFEDINVAENQKAAEEAVEKSGQYGVPVIEINSKIIVGFDKEKIEQAMNKDSEKQGSKNLEKSA